MPGEFSKLSGAFNEVQAGTLAVILLAYVTRSELEKSILSMGDRMNSNLAQAVSDVKKEIAVAKSDLLKWMIAQPIIVVGAIFGAVKVFAT
ncbi:MAG: hypothetical protein ACFB22_02940 [Rhodothalassiaceae bacterium]